jgi:hypothetical protein
LIRSTFAELAIGQPGTFAWVTWPALRRFAFNRIGWKKAGVGEKAMLVLPAFHVMTRICRLRKMRQLTISVALAATWPSLDLRSLVNIREQRAR